MGLLEKMEVEMEDKNRLELIREIEKKRDSSLICYIAGDRENVSTRIAPDCIRVIFRHLEKIGKSKKIDLLLYTRGGDVLTPWRLINLICEYTDQFNVIVPFRAYSAGTLICLGAHEILMGKMGELGPIDPVVANAFNPTDPEKPTARVPISVEDVSSYLNLALEKGKLKEENSLLSVFMKLVERVHPLSLGNVHRNYQLIRSTARKLLKLSKIDRKESEITAIVDYLTKKLYAHNYMISRREAKNEIGLNIVYPPSPLEDIVWELYKSYEKKLKLQEPFSPHNLNISSGLNETDFKVYGGIIESRAALDYFVYNGKVTKQYDGANQFDIKIISQKWRTKK